MNKNVKLARLLVLSILIIGTMITIVSPVQAYASDILFQNMNQSVRVYNNNIDQIPGIVKSLLGNEKSYVTIDMDDGSKLEIKMVMKDARIVQFEKIIGFDESATIKVATNEKFILELMNSNNPIDTFMNAMDKGIVKVEGSGIVMYAIIKSLGILMGIAKLIGNIIGIIKSIFG